MKKKVIYYLLYIFSITFVIFSILMMNTIHDENIYNREKQEYLYDQYDSITYNHIFSIMNEYKDMHDISFNIKNTNIEYYDIRLKDEILYKDLSPHKQESMLFHYYVVMNEQELLITSQKYLTVDECYEVNARVVNKPIVKDSYYFAYLKTELLYLLKYLVYPLLAISIIGTIYTYRFFIKNAVSFKNKLSYMPFDFYTILCALAAFITLFMTYLSLSSIYSHDKYIMIIIGYLIIITLFLYYSIETSIKIKEHIIFSELYVIKIIKKIINIIYKIISYIPMIYHFVIFYLIMSLLEFIISITLSYGTKTVFILFIKIITFLYFAYFVYSFYKIKEAANMIVSGNLNYQIDTKVMFGDFKECSHSLNQISDVVKEAVNESIKSERMKTELITNVSHDIKTPLTSIINYTDLIEKEEIGNEKVKEYIEVLKRQSSKLKRLIEDLVEASKASTGNIDLDLNVLELNTLIEQINGEYENQLLNKHLDLIYHSTDSVYIYGDGRRLARVFDNIFNNICKYSLEHTRVYLDVKISDQKVIIIFKNTSKDELNIDASELMERFVRGDHSRHSEGNGLGLSIARSLIEMHHGHFDIMIDGDLFKTIITLPLYNR